MGEETNVVAMQTRAGSYLGTVSLWRMPDGTIRGQLEDMPKHVIEDRAEISARFLQLSNWCLEACQSFLRQASRFDPENHS